MADPAHLRAYLDRRSRRMAAYLRVLVPDAAEAVARLQELVRRVGDLAGNAPGENLDAWLDDLARDVAADRWDESTRPFSPPLFRQVADFAGPLLDELEGRERVLAEVLPQLPPPERDLLRKRYELGLTPAQIAGAEGRPVAAVTRDLAGLHETLVNEVRGRTLPEPPGGAADIGRLSHQLLDGTISDDSRVVFETLLLADPPAQAHHVRHVAVVTALTWQFRGAPALPDWPKPPEPLPLSRRERFVTGAFVAACVATLLFVILLFSGAFR